MTRFMELHTFSGGSKIIVNFDNVISIIKMADGHAKIYYLRKDFSDEVRESYEEILNRMAADELKRSVNDSN